MENAIKPDIFDVPSTHVVMKKIFFGHDFHCIDWIASVTMATAPELTEVRHDIWNERVRNHEDTEKKLKEYSGWNVGEADRKANKSGPHQSVFWVREKQISYEDRVQRPFEKRYDTVFETGATYQGDWKDNKRHGTSLVTIEW